MSNSKRLRMFDRKVYLILPLILLLCASEGSVFAQGAGETVLFEETFEDTLFAARGWYDYSFPFETTTFQHALNSTTSCEFHWLKPGDTTPVMKGARAHMPPVEGITLTFYIKFSDNWTWTGVGWHPHFIMFTTNVDGDYIGPAHTHTTLYVEPVDGKLVYGDQDAENIDLSHLGENLVGLTENRAVTGGNGDPDGHGGSYYRPDSTTWANGRMINSDSLCFTDNPGPFYKGDWHQVKAHIQLNSVIDGKGVANGVVQYWYDGKKVIDYHDVMMRTGQHPTMKLDHFLLLPYYGPGVPHEQTIWIDDIRIVQDEQVLPAVDPPVYNTTLVDEHFEDTLFTARGWYDDPRISLDAITYTQGSGHSARFDWTGPGNTSPAGRGGRLQFDPSEGFTVSFYVKLSADWDWPADPSSPQSLLWFVTNEDDQYTSPLNTFLTAQLTNSNGKLSLILSDYKNIDVANLGQNLVEVTESRAIAGGNGDSDRYGGSYSLPAPGAPENAKRIASGGQLFTNDPGPFLKSDWHYVKAHLQINSLVDGKGVANGVVQFWFDGKAVVNDHDVMFRTGKHPNMKFNQLMLLPYIGGGAAHAQSLWLDDFLLVKDVQTLRIPVALNPDFNGDGRVSLSDMLAFLLKAIKDPQAPELDLNNDGVYDINDAVEMFHEIIKNR